MEFFIRIFKINTKPAIVEKECDVNSLEMASIFSKTKSVSNLNSGEIDHGATRRQSKQKRKHSIRENKDSSHESLCYNDKYQRTLKATTRRKNKKKRRHNK
ncbi:uncharacterized protein GVI51_B03113 [Nakaseomyces glabratus]|uniref:Uncharacterized protein n=2 Tax=Candida glabrata TaxID=5478 RepID=Q6FXK4_CANGA|nr:uncharacterized protein CAGL0B03223g [Nakaseomyces glabratus]KAH7591015.1 hypothetical protein J7298_00343 [Nakaseomyces glabratus]KAH7608894.1 hypothetical protein J7295_00349 [Nakaseomyces glabratus]KAH7609144.1 hypothetical protein J7293_00347 [Nakaseomyces glabratus]KAH7610019.1 hypothetical protein J7294_00347 [Nakaseomyces glabratus]KAH7615261.1 hypothetical protein J7292_00345 [Nakaseomyces glabratus]|eukprot:XP_445111.1 uncharacterized protein CAGL0B03223g [[Candida] glabrata]